jgi:hypothetical protein
VPFIQLFQIHTELLSRHFTGIMTPSVGEQNTADIQEQTGYCISIAHRSFIRQSYHRCHRICAASSGSATLAALTLQENQASCGKPDLPVDL